MKERIMYERLPEPLKRNAGFMLWRYEKVKGVTTNPSLIAKEGLSQKEIISQIVKLVDGPISAEVTAEDYEGMVKQGR